MKCGQTFRKLCLILVAMLVFCVAIPSPKGLADDNPFFTRESLMTIQENARMDIQEKSTSILLNGEKTELDELCFEVLQNMVQEVFAANPNDISFHSLSPDGETLLASYGTVLLTLNINTLAVSVLVPDYIGSQFSEEHGFVDFNRFVKERKVTLLDPSACVWSPDGRYITIKSWHTAMLYMSLYIDLYVVDVQEGRLYNAVAYPGESVLEDAAVIQAQFSADGNTLYYTVYSGITSKETPYRVTLCAYDIEKGTHEVIASGADEGQTRYGDLQDLQLMPDGSLVQLIDTPRMSTPRGLFVYTPDHEGQWQRSEVEIPVGPLHSFEMAASARSGYGIIGFGSTRVRGVAAISRFQQAEDFAGIQDLLIISDFDQTVAETVAFSSLTDENGDLTALAKKHFYPAVFGINEEDADESLLWEPDQPALYPLAFALSPSGDEALVLLRSPDTDDFGMVCLNLADHTLRRVEANVSQVSAADLDQAKRADRIGLEWRENGLVLLHLRSEGKLLYLPTI